MRKVELQYAIILIGAALLPLQALSQDLWTAIQRSDLERVDAFLNAGGDPDALSTPSVAEPTVASDSIAQFEVPAWPLLKVAIYDREEDIALLLLEAGADFDGLVFEGLGNPLSLVASQGMSRVLRHLIERDPGRLRNASPTMQRGLLQRAITRGYFQSLQVLLEEAERVGLHWDSEQLSDAASLAIVEGQYDLARMLHAAGALPKSTMLLGAARDGSPGIVRYALSLGADPNARLEEEFVHPRFNARTPMDYAWMRYDFAQDAEGQEAARLVMYELQRGGAGPTEGRPADAAIDGMALLESIVDPAERMIDASRLGYYDVAAADLAAYRPSPGAMRSALTAALGRRHNDIAMLLLEAGAPVDAGPLHAAAAGNSPGIVREILRLGADPNERFDGGTPAESWWARYQRMDFGAKGDLVLHELINGGAEVCWLTDHFNELNIFAADFMWNTATHCWPD